MYLEKLRKLVIKSLFTDDDLFDIFVLKGGNALLVHGINSRASIDVDVSMEESFKEEDLEDIQNKLDKSLKETFSREGYTVIDVVLNKQPRKMPEEKEKYWGGYKLEFKIVSLEYEKLYKENEIDLQKLRNLALSVEGVYGSKSSGGKVFKVDISKYEFCKSKVQKDLDGFPIYVYAPLTLVYEKLRAICQQHEEYNLYVETNRKPRARDFFDIYSIVEGSNLLSNTDMKEDVLEEENLKDLSEIFSLKKVPLDFLSIIENYRDFHEENFSSVKSTVLESEKLESYDFYFDYTVNICRQISEKLISLDMMDSKVATA